MPIENLINNDIAWTVEEINKLYREGKIKGFTVQIMHTDGEFSTASCGDISFLEKLGMVETAKNDIFISAND